MLLGDGSGGFAAAPGSPFGVGSDPHSVAIGDLNGDTKPDLVTANSDSDNVTVLLGDGSGGFAAAPGSPFGVGSDPTSVAIGDLNGDTKPDLVTANIGSNNVTVLLGDGSGGFAAAPGSPFGVGTAPLSVAIGDLNGDTKPDLVTANSVSDDVTVLLNTRSAPETTIDSGPSGLTNDPTPTFTFSSDEPGSTRSSAGSTSMSLPPALAPATRTLVLALRWLTHLRSTGDRCHPADRPDAGEPLVHG